jgi:hypothetical protein
MLSQELNGPDVMSRMDQGMMGLWGGSHGTCGYKTITSVVFGVDQHRSSHAESRPPQRQTFRYASATAPTQDPTTPDGVLKPCFARPHNNGTIPFLVRMRQESRVLLLFRRSAPLS